MSEQIYDDEIAPTLAALSKRCKDLGMGFFAMVAYDDDGSVGRTVGFPENTPFMLRLADTLGKSWVAGGGVNIDAFMIALMRHARENGHSSVCLQRLGVPIAPEPVPAKSRTSEGTE